MSTIDKIIEREKLKINIGFDEVRYYNREGKIVLYKDEFGYEEKYEYDEKGRFAHYKDTTGEECWKEYDEVNTVVRKLIKRNNAYYFNGKKLEKKEE